jgi:dynein heavy chain
MKKLVDELEATQAEETRLRNEKDDCERKVDLAKALINGLANERENWKVDLAKNKENRENIVGDIIISSGVIAYLGVFIKQYRDECTQSWADMLMKFQIKSTKNVSVETVLGDAVKIRQWQIQGLPQDSFSTDSAIIADYSERWCLFIDPQMQANLWLKNRYKEEQLKVIKPTNDPNFVSRTLENSINFGTPVILEDANETFDPLLDPLLAKQIEKKGSEYFIKFGDQGISFNPDFKFYITTKMSRPHYSPEVCVKVTMLNFMATQDGLLDQMLSIIVRIEEPVKYERRNQNIQTKADNQKKQAELQDKILNMVANSKDDILEDRDLKVTLDESKIQSVQIEQTLKEMENQNKAIEQIRDQFVPVATRVSRLFFVLTDLINVDPMYQYSLEFFRLIYEGAVRSVEGVFEKSQKNDRKAYFISEFTWRLYKNVCRSLFEKDKLLFSFLICLKIMDEVQKETGGLDFPVVRFLMAGATKVELTKPNPTGESGWLTNKAWLAMLEMSEKFKQFKGFDDSFAANIDAWEKIYNSPNP